MNEHAHDNHIERHEEETALNIAIREAIAALVVRRIDKNAFAVERKDNPKNWHIVDMDNGCCNCAWSVFIVHAPCIHILAVKNYLAPVDDDIPF